MTQNLDVEAEIDHTEVKNGNKIAVVFFKGEDWDGDRVERIKVPVEASPEDMREIVRTTMENKLYSQEIGDRVTEIRDAAGDPKGLKVTPNRNPKKDVDDLVEFHKCSDKEMQAVKDTEYGTDGEVKSHNDITGVDTVPDVFGSEKEFRKAAARYEKFGRENRR